MEMSVLTLAVTLTLTLTRTITITITITLTLTPTQEKMAQSEMSVPSQSVMARYRASSISAPQRTSAASGTGRDSSVDTPTERNKKTRDSFAFSNDDRSSSSVLRSFARTSLNRRPEDLDVDTGGPPVGQ